ncbi:MAG: hypothetical protein QM791_08500 [Ferruginibacter sp.]
MNRFKTGLLLFAALLFSVYTKAQSLEEGRKFMYYERYKSAKSVLEKVVAANPNNIDAVYWLGQAMIAPDENKDIAGAKALYQKTLMANSNSPLLLVGMGHIELLEGKAADAKNRFETAISLSQGKNAAVLSAIGLANVASKDGDLNYAVDKLKLATGIKKMNDPEVYINLGDAYKKLGEGGPAQSAYENALTLVPNYARASYKIGKIYQTQGIQQQEIYMRYFNEAIAKDPAYAPVYQNLYELLYTTNVGESARNLELYLANADDDPKNCYYQASMKYAQGLFDETITKANQCLAAPDAYVKLHGLIAYAYNRKGDSLNAKKFFETYFQKASPDVIGAGDYSTYASVLLKFPGSDSIAGLNVDKAIALDSVEANKLNYAKTMTAYYDAQKKYKQLADWYKKVIGFKKDVRKTDLYNAGYNYFRAGEYQSSIDVFSTYSQKFADDPFGYYMSGKSKWAIDSTLDQGLANSDFEKAIEVGLKDSVKYKAQLIGSYKYFIVYSVTKKDKAAALAYCDKVLSLDPNDAETIGNKTTIAAMNFNAPANRPRTQGVKANGTR